jgi:hypothetical protein
MTLLAAACALAAGAGGCQALNEPIYIGAPAALDVMGTDMTGAPNRVMGSVVLRFRKPNPAEQMQLDADKQRLGGITVPWLKRDRIHL